MHKLKTSLNKQTNKQTKQTNKKNPKNDHLQIVKKSEPN